MSAPAEDVTNPLEGASPRLVQELKVYLADHRERAEQLLVSGGDDSGTAAGQQLSRALDGLLGSLYHATLGLMGVGGAAGQVSLAAVGSYGRSTLGLYSDLDVRVLCDGHRDLASEAIDALVYPLWDVGLSVGHQVVVVDEYLEVARTDMATATSLLDWRHIAGPSHLETDLLRRAYESIFGPANLRDFLEKLYAGAEQRQDRFSGSVYWLEPDVRNGPGGIRDLDVAQWAAKARWHARSLQDLLRAGVLVPREFVMLEAAERFHWRVRNNLHFRARRRSDRLSFERQEQLAGDFGYGSGGAGVEQFMSDYYRHARTLRRFRDTLLYRAEPPPRQPPREQPLGKGLKLVNGALTLSLDRGGAMGSKPELALRIYREAMVLDRPIHKYARDAIIRATTSADFCARLCSSPEAGPLFVDLLTWPKRTPFRQETAIEELHDVGLLAAMIPEFGPVIGRVHHDMYHTLTVDAHSVAAVGFLASLRRGDLAEQHPVASRLAAELARPRVVAMAALLHDVGKDVGGQNHSVRGKKMVAPILTRLGASAGEIEAVEQLVLQHLRMYHVATRRDIDDPDTVRAFCAEVNGREGLRELYLLTVCDVSTTSPGALNEWKARMLDDLYFAADRFFDEGLPSVDDEHLAEVRREVTERVGGAVSSEALSDFLAKMPRRYLFSNSVADVVAQVGVATQGQADFSLELLREDGDHLQFAISAPDRPGLLSLLTGTLAAARLSVVAAQIYSWNPVERPPQALDILWVTRASGTEGSDGLTNKLRANLRRVLVEGLSPEELGGGLRPSRSAVRKEPDVATRINLDNRASKKYTVIEVTTRDRLGILYRVSTALLNEGLNIALAKINTEGNRVADVFYVTGEHGEKLTDGSRMEALSRAVRDALALDVDAG